MECASAGSNLTQSLVIAEEKKRIKEAVERAQQAVLMGMPNMACLNGSVTFQAPKETKKIPVDSAFLERTVTIGSNLDPK